MTDYSPSRIGQVNGAGDTSALFLKVFPGEVLGAFREVNKIMALHIVRTIANGKSAQFPATGKATASYHTPGQILLGQTINHAERVISVDGLLLADTFVAEIDEAMNHYDVRQEYAALLGQSLATKADQQLLQLAVLAARASTTVTGGDGGSALTDAAAKTDGEVIGSLVFDAAQAMDEKYVPETDRYVAFKPAQYYLAVQATKFLNRDWGGKGELAGAMLPQVANMSVIKTNNLPSTVIAAETGANNTYNGDFSKTSGVAWHKSAFGTVKLRDLKTEREYMIQNQGTLMVAKYAMGHGILRPESAVEMGTP